MPGKVVLQVEAAPVDSQQLVLRSGKFALNGTLVVLEPMQFVAVGRRIFGEARLLGTDGFELPSEAFESLVDDTSFELEIAGLQLLGLQLPVEALERLFVLFAHGDECAPLAFGGGEAP